MKTGGLSLRTIWFCARQMWSSQEKCLDTAPILPTWHKNPSDIRPSLDLQ